MGNRSSRESLDYYPFFVPPPVPVVHQRMRQPLPLHGYRSDSTRSDSADSYGVIRKRRRWYHIGRKRDKHRARELWYRPFVSPVVPPPPGFVYNPAPTWRAPDTFLPPMADPAQYGGMQFPMYGTAPPVVPRRVEQPVTGAEWRGQSRRRRRRRPSPEFMSTTSSSDSESPITMPEPVMMPQPQLVPPPITVQDSGFSPPFKPFPPLPHTHSHRPPTPPRNIMISSPYKNSFRELVHPTPRTRAQALEIIRDRERTNIESVRRRWQMEDEEREKLIREKREQRELLLKQSVTIPVSVAPTMAPGDPRFTKKKKTRKSLFDTFTSAFKRKGDEVMYTNTSTVGGMQPVMPSFLSVPMHVRPVSPVPSAHTVYLTPGPVTMPVPSVTASPFLPTQNEAERFTTPL